MQRFSYLFLALFVLARAQQYTSCNSATGCSSSSPCTCVAVVGTTGCACAETLCQEYCTRQFGANCQCSVKTDAAAGSTTCVIPTTCKPSTLTCSESSSGYCGDLPPPTAATSTPCRTYSRCGVSNGACAWLCPPCFDGTVTPNTCGGKARLATVADACNVTCPDIGCGNGFNVYCPDPCSGKCTGTPACPSGSSPVDPSAVVPCVLDQTGTCNWAPNCRATTSTCLTDAGNCGPFAPPTACPAGWVLEPGTVFTPTCDTIYTASATSPNTGTDYYCKWRDNCKPTCEVVNETCGGRPKPTSCPAGSFSTTGVAPSYTCRGASSTTCEWYSDATCIAGCEFKWPVDSLAPLCGGNPFPCPNVPAVLPASAFTTQVAAGSTTDSLVSISRLSTLCYPNADKRCVFPPIGCPTGCYSQLRAAGTEHCGGIAKDLSKAGCTDAQIPVAKCAASTANAAECGWVYSCETKVVNCFKDSSRYTCGGVSVTDTCPTRVAGSYMSDFTCNTDSTGKCVSSPICTDIETCGADLSPCLSSTTATGTATANFAPTTAPACSATETQVSPAQCCCSKGTGKCYFKGLKCVPKEPCQTCTVDSTVKTVCPAGTQLLSLPTCALDSTGKCGFTPIRCTPIPVPTCNGNCPISKYCDFGFVSKAVSCDAACNGIPECVPDPCTTSDPCKCNKANGCVWIAGPAGSTQRSFCASGNSRIATSTNVPAGTTINNGADFCKPTTTPPRDHVIDAVTTNSYTGGNIQTAIANFIAQVKALDSKLCKNGELCLLKYSVSFFAVGAPELSTDGTKNLKLYATVLFLPRDPANDPGTPSQEVLDFYCEPIMRLIGTLSKAFDFDVDKNRLGTCSFTISLKRDLQAGTSSYNAGVTVPSDVYQKYISASPSLISGCLLVVSALVALFLF